MNFYELEENLLSLFAEMGSTFSEFQKEMELPCLSGCGKCCLNPEVEASVYEMIPMALEIIRENRADEYLDLLEKNLENACVIYQKNSPDGSLGQCGRYKTRPTLCREFGVSGHIKKDGSTELSICKLIKAQNPDYHQKNFADKKTPVMSEWTYRLMSLHPELLKERKTINLALKEALEKVLFWMNYETQA
jgi:uncharacterized protein